MQKTYKFLIAGLAIGLIVASLGTYALTAGQSNSAVGLDCEECHAEGHGSVIAPDVNVNGTILLTGDLAKDEYIIVADIFKMPQKDVSTLESQYPEGIPSRGVPVLEFLEAHGVRDFDRLVIYADDFMLSLKRSDINENTVLVPKEYSIRILGDNMPIATWLEGINTIVIVGSGKGDAIKVDNSTVSYGQMLDSGMQTMPVSLRSLGYVYKNDSYSFDTGFMVTGISLKDLLFKEGYTSFNSVSVDGISISRNGVLTGSYFLTRNNGTIVMATADKNRPQWPEVNTITVA